MQYDFRPWFDSPSNADILLHVCSETQLSCVENGAATTTCGKQDETAQQQRVTGHAVDVNEGGQAGSSKQAPDQYAPSEQPDSSRKRQGQDSDGSNADPATKRCRRAEGAQQRLRTYHAHALALCAQSQFFKASMSDMWQQQQQQQPARDQPEAQQSQQEMQAPQGGASNTQQAVPVSRLIDVTITIQVEELQAMDLVLRTIYGFKAPAASPDNTALLFQCLHLADRFDVLQCADLILTCFKDAVVTAQVLQHVCDAPPGVVSRPAFQDLVGRCKDIAQRLLKQGSGNDPALMNACKRFIAHVYGDVPAVNRNQQLRGEFCSLPFGAVLAWAESDELRVHSENCVVYLLSAWVTAAQQPKGQGVTREQLEQLSRQVRVLHLGPAYQYYILPQLGWFKGCSGMAHLPTLLAYKGRDSAGKAIFPSTGLKFCTDNQEFPQQWVAKPRQQARVTDADRLLTWEVGGEQLQESTEGQPLWSAPASVYVNGFLLGLCAYCTVDESARCLGLCAGVDWNELHANGILWPDKAAIVLGPVTLGLMHSPEGKVTSKEIEQVVLSDWQYSGPDEYLSSAPTMSELLAPYLREGKLHVEARFTTVDEVS